MNKSKVAIILAGVLAGVQVLAGAANLTDLVGGTVAAWIVLSAGVLQAVAVVVTNGQVNKLVADLEARAAASRAE